MMFKTIDLFSGIGGIRRGFELAGDFKNLLSAEIDKYACLTYEHMYGENPYNDVSKEEFKKKVTKIKYDVLLAGFPCQAFSIAGKKQGFRDATRGTLFFEVADILDRTKPKAFLLENVEGLLRHKKGETFKIIAETLVKELGYNVVGVDLTENGELGYASSSFVRNSKNFGVPQNRPRVYLMGFRKDIIDSKKIQQYSLPIKRENKAIFENLNTLLELDVEDRYYIPVNYVKTLERHRKSHKEAGNGFGYQVVNRDKSENVSNAILATGGSGKERNIIYQPKEGIGGKIVPGKQSPLNKEGLRFMTPKEWGRLQGFYDYAFMDKEGKEYFSFPNTVSITQQYKQFGNSVTIPVIEELAKYMKKILKENL